MFLAFIFKLGVIALSTLITISTWSNLVLLWYSQFLHKENITYDLIIVGGGSAGSTLAGRLAENGLKILLLEAGGSPPWWATIGTIDIPIFGPMWQRTDLDWAYKTESQEHSCGALKNQASSWPRGRVLGGSGRLNNMVYLRGHEKDWERWGLSTSSQLHYFKKSELQLGRYRNNTDYHHSDGWLPVSDPPMNTALSSAVLEAARELGYFVGDLNTMSQTGFMEVQTTSLNGARFSADKAFLYSSRLPNLHVQTHSFVSQVILGKQNKAEGVKYFHTNSWFYARSRHGVILSAGTVESPKILMQSGIGPRDHLSEVGIQVRIHSPHVGKNLQDHVSTGSDLVLLNSSLSLNLANLAHPQSFLEYAFKGEGPLTHGGCEATGLLHTKFSDMKKDPPDIQLLILPAGHAFDDGSLIQHNLGLKDEVWLEYFSLKNYEHQKTSVTILVILLHPRSTGVVKLRSKDPFESPLIDPKYLTDPRDVETLVEGVQIVKKILQTKAMSNLGAYLNPKKMPGCEKYKFDTSDYWQCYTRMLTYTVYHPVGTCQMGPKGRAVVDYSFRVQGASNLYVVDASVIPALPSANINAAVIALAERASDVITGILQHDSKRTAREGYSSIMTKVSKLNTCTQSVNTT